MWWHVLAPMWVLSPLSGLMFPCFHIWLVLCLLANVLSPVIDDAAAWHTATSHGHQPPGDIQSMAVFFGRFCPLFYSFKGHIMKNKRQCCQLWRCSILVRPGEDDLRFLDRAGHINRDPDLISTKVGENWPIILTFVKIRPPFVKKISHFSVNITVEFAR